MRIKCALIRIGHVHICDTTIQRIVIHYKASCTALYLFNLADLNGDHTGAAYSKIGFTTHL